MTTIAVKGAQVPALGLGTWQLHGRKCRDAVRLALELGYRHIDTAQMYGNEAEVGAALRESRLDRAAVFVTTKIQPGNLGPAAMRRSAEESLRKLGLDQVDLLLVHWPSREAPLGVQLAALARLREAGRTRFIGVSNFTTSMLREAVETHGADLLCNQVEYHPYLSQRRVLAVARGYGMMVTAYSPLAKGAVERDPKMAWIARKYGKTAAQVTLRWLLDQQGVAAIPKASSREHLAANVAVFDFTLAPEHRAAIDALAANRRLVDFGGWWEWDPA